MKIINEIQGSAGWLASRLGKRNASEASVMMGVSQKLKRNELIHMKKTLSEKEVSDWVQKHLFDKGHAAEASARPIAEKVAGEKLYPITAADDDEYLQASYDGMNMMETVNWEHKMWNEAKAADVRNGVVPEEDRWQVVQGLVISGGEKCLYMVSDGTEANCVWCWHHLQEGDADALVRGWKQFDADLAVYVPTERAVEVVGKAPEALPALRIEVTGMVTASNLAEFKQTALALIDNVNAELETDQDFADAEKAVKWCADIETRLKAGKQHALSQTATIDELFRTIDAITEEARQKRLSLGKLIDSRKTAIRDDIVMTAAKALHEHVEALNVTLGGRVRLPSMPADFAGVIKGKKSIDSLRNAADTELARAKIAAGKLAEHMLTNLNTLREKSKGFDFLFSDAAALVAKSPEDLASTITARLVEHKQLEADKLEAEREKIRKEEIAKLLADQEAAKKLNIPQKTEAQPKQHPSAANYAPQGSSAQPVRKTAVKAVASAKPERPTDAAILGALADAFDVSQGEAYRWIEDMIMSTQAAAG
jgi:predicted phage-related endonuclease